MENLIFKEMNLSKEILKAVEQMGFEEATPIQSKTIPIILEGKDLTAQAPTGTGKTCAFGIPLIERVDKSDDNIQVLIICPTRELVIQVADELGEVAKFKKNIRIVPIYGGQQIERQIMLLKKKPQIVVATPGRMMDHMRRKTAKIDKLRAIVLDECDEMLNMGFREDIDEILLSVPKERQTILYSATLSKEIMNITKLYQKDAEFVRVTHKELTVPTIVQYYVEVKNKNKIDVLTRIIDANNYKLCLVFCNTKKMVDELTSDLNTRGYGAEALHGDMRQMQRDRVMSRYRKGLVEILVATDVAARGIDVDDIEVVFNFDIPSDEEYYVHRIGRTGRANRTGIAYTFVAGKEIYKLKDIMRYTHAAITMVKAPTIRNVEEVRLEGIMTMVESIIQNGKLSRYIDYVEKIVANEANDYSSLDIAAALLSIQLGTSEDNEEEPDDEPAEEFKPSKKRKKDRFGSSHEAGMTRLFINAGTLDGIKPNIIVKMVASSSSISGHEIGAIDIREKFSFFDVPDAYADEIISALSGKVHNKRKLNLEIANRR